MRASSSRLKTHFSPHSHSNPAKHTQELRHSPFSLWNSRNWALGDLFIHAFQLLWSFFGLSKCFPINEWCSWSAFQTQPHRSQILPLLWKLLQFSPLRAPLAQQCNTVSSFPPQSLLHSCFPEQHFSSQMHSIHSFPWVFVYHYFILRMFVVLLWAVSPLINVTSRHFSSSLFPTSGLHMDFPPSLEKLCLTVLCRDSPDLPLILHRYPGLLRCLPSIWDTTSESLIPGFST